jgi:hypothetical protein
MAMSDLGRFWSSLNTARTISSAYHRRSGRADIGGNAIISNWQDQALTMRHGGVWLTGGQNYSIDLNYYENAGLAGLKLEWSGADTGGQRQTLTARNILTFSDRMGIDIDTGNMFQAYDRTGGDMTQLRQLYPSWI